ncbi:MAG: fibronectin type III domain-containing protein, partial [Candidatus Riflebacteria bacterium]|nr:fibronectin type III domain-containing protein [Candidatus Riflebacteria bacterium]
MKNRALFISILLGVGLIFGILGCWNGRSGNNPVGPVSSNAGLGNNPVGTAQSVSFKIVLPEHGTVPVSSLMPAIRATDLASVSVTFKLILVNVGNASQPTNTLLKTVSVDASGTAMATFSAVPALTCIGDIHIKGGNISSYTDFHGAADLKQTLDNVVTLSPKTDHSRIDVIAATIESIIASTTLYQKVALGLASKISGAIVGLDATSPTIYDSAMGAFLSCGNVTRVVDYAGLPGNVDFIGAQREYSFADGSQVTYYGKWDSSGKRLPSLRVEATTTSTSTVMVLTLVGSHTLIFTTRDSQGIKGSEYVLFEDLGNGTIKTTMFAQDSETGIMGTEVDIATPTATFSVRGSGLEEVDWMEWAIRVVRPIAQYNFITKTTTRIIGGVFNKFYNSWLDAHSPAVPVPESSTKTKPAPEDVGNNSYHSFTLDAGTITVGATNKIREDVPFDLQLSINYTDVTKISSTDGTGKYPPETFLPTISEICWYSESGIFPYTKTKLATLSGPFNSLYYRQTVTPKYSDPGTLRYWCEFKFTNADHIEMSNTAKVDVAKKILNSIALDPAAVSVPSGKPYDLTNVKVMATYDNGAPEAQVNNGIAWTGDNVSGTTFNAPAGTGNTTLKCTYSEGDAAATATLTITYKQLAAPTNVKATAGFGQVTLAWDAVTDATGYRVYWGTSSGVTISSSNKVDVSTNSYAATSLANDTTYYFVVTSLGNSAESVVSSQVSAK